ncbi:hypothetical protein NI35_0938 [Salmonella enterica subsp. enterica serovar Cerro]|nr:hypothetical protein NI35_0938 [Salmonella enterica subsp. enterica serovar Cerro]
MFFCSVPLRSRFIPAGAGNTRVDQLLKIYAAVYPRWRGEHGSGWQKSSQGSGLSPLARGTLILKGGEAVPVRFIPAGAGNTLNLPN